MFGQDLGVRWVFSKKGECDRVRLIGECEGGSPERIGLLMQEFNNVTGCTWRIGKTSISHMFKRSVHYECVHRAPTHVNRNVEYIVGQRYMRRGEDNCEYICMRICESKNKIWFFNKENENITCAHVNNEYYMVRNNHQSFGCEASLTILKVRTGVAVVVVEWKHNHDLKSFASTSRRDPSLFVQDWFHDEYKKGVPAMKAYRGYVDQLFSEKNVCIGDVVQIMADRYC